MNLKPLKNFLMLTGYRRFEAGMKKRLRKKRFLHLFVIESARLKADVLRIHTSIALTHEVFIGRNRAPADNQLPIAAWTVCASTEKRALFNMPIVPELARVPRHEQRLATDALSGRPIILGWAFELDRVGITPG
jgi:hypothetical protein